MPIARLCAVDEIPEGSAAVLTSDDIAVLVIRRRGQWLAVAPVCVYLAGALSKGVLASCFEGNAPKCNRGPADSRPQGDRCAGTEQAPIVQYEINESGGLLYIDTARQRLSSLRYLSCSPSVGPDGAEALRINMWWSEEGGDVESVLGLPRIDGGQPVRC